jgi:hypothetical protein
MSQLRKREDGSEEGAASAVMDIIRNNIRIRLKIDRRMAAPFITGIETLPGQEEINETKAVSKNIKGGQWKNYHVLFREMRV